MENIDHEFDDITNGDYQEIFDEIATRDFDNPDYNNLRGDEKFLIFASLISNDPADHLNPIFEDLLKSYVKFKTFTNAEEAQITEKNIDRNEESGMKNRKIQPQKWILILTKLNLW